MMERKAECVTEADMEALGREIAASMPKGGVISLRGPLGAGKTVFARGVARYLGITEAVVSPTFTLVQEYEGTLPMYHMDLYRLNGPDDFINIGGEEMLYGAGFCLIEWSEKIQELLPSSTVYVDITVNADQSRTVLVKEASR